MRYYFPVKRASYPLCLSIIVFFAIMLPAQTRRNPSKSKKKSAPSQSVPQPEIPASYRDLLNNASQAILVTTPNWNSVDGSLQRYEKANGKWQQIGERVPIVVAKNGLAWDAQAEMHVPPVKHEGDGRSPAGVFSIGEAFGFAPSEPDLKLPYRPLTDSIECVDDASSQSYNQIVDRSEMSNPDWNSSEKMRSIDVYKEGLVVNYNVDHIPADGSCIFMHIWKGPGHGTAGCTAMDEDKLKEVMSWLDEAKKPVLVQFPEPIYKHLKSSWNLP